jgi:rhodanese-related sulfurtransferase
MTMKTLKLMLALLLVLTAPLGYCAKSHVLSKAELDALLAQPDKVLIIDVRRPDEISEIGGLRVYLSVQVGDLERSLAWIPKERTIVTLSNHAARATQAADLLLAHGFKVAGAAGAQTYEQQGGTLTKVPKPTPTAQAGARK